MIQYLAAVFCDQNQVLDPDADAVFRKIDPRFNGENLSWLNDVLIDGRDVAGFVIFDTDGMPCSVGEIVSVPFFFYLSPAGVVHIAHPGTWPGGVNSSLLGLADNFIYFSGLV